MSLSDIFAQPGGLVSWLPSWLRFRPMALDDLEPDDDAVEDHRSAAEREYLRDIDIEVDF
ncbi:hypothetical protein OEZ60_00950 [Defluviimonas sp. WL0024]|uniref:Uncharacterized protein n=1 Tax=Albidovulum salinarum TaxID=2984153 RepID=A0ABT2WY21_9RHOB|nr:hypothetical protein [Defluviimonas sp. WL0024]MCU9846573.1 hypothetical protein [Defluviimonas sp. WL0024]